jgi:hypothetical protein
MSTDYKIDDVKIESLEGLGSSYRMKGFFVLQHGKERTPVHFEGIAFGGHYGGHNVNISISEEAKKSLISPTGFLPNSQSLDDILSEVQRRILNNEMAVDYDAIKKDAISEETLNGLGDGLPTS